MDDKTFFDLDMELPCRDIANQSTRLIGFRARYSRIYAHLRMMLSPESIEKWSQNHHNTRLPLCDIISERHPIFVFSGDVGTGKTETAKCIANKIAGEMKRESRLLKLSTRIRGQGLHGEMSDLVHRAFEQLEEVAGKKRLGFLLIDEADTLAAVRSTEQMHQEEKAAVNTLIQKLDDLRRKGGRAAVFLCTNRPDVVDPAVMRRAALHMDFTRPNDGERRELLKQDLDGLALSEKQIADLVEKTGPNQGQKAGYTFSDFRLRMLPEAMARVYPEQPLTYEILAEAITNTKPSPVVQ